LLELGDRRIQALFFLLETGNLRFSLPQPELKSFEFPLQVSHVGPERHNFLALFRDLRLEVVEHARFLTFEVALNLVYQDFAILDQAAKLVDCALFRLTLPLEGFDDGCELGLESIEELPLRRLHRVSTAQGARRSRLIASALPSVVRVIGPLPVSFEVRLDETGSFGL